MRARTLRPHEDWPHVLGDMMGFNGPMLDHDWCWIVEDDLLRPQAGLLACPAHGAILLLRLAAVPDAPKAAIRHLFRKALNDAKSRGNIGWITLTDPTADSGIQLDSLIRHVGGVQWPRPMVLSFGLMATIGGL